MTVNLFSHPACIIGGAPKSGTSSLHSWLTAHPSVTGSFRKETYFFSEKEFWGRAPEHHVSQGPARYRQCFPQPTQDTEVFLESTASYLYSPTALRELSLIEPQPKVLFVLREPARQIYSTFTYFRDSWAALPPSLSFEEYVALLQNGERIGDHALIEHALAHGAYVDFLARWKASFGSNLMVRLFEDMRADPRSYTMGVAEWLGIDPAFFSTYDFPIENETYQVRSHSLQALNVALRSRLKQGPLFNLAKSAYRAVNTTNKKRPSAESEASLQSLAASFSAKNELLAEMFDLDLSVWSSRPSTDRLSKRRAEPAPPGSS